MMEKMKRLPAAEFEIMKVVWANNPPITTGIIMEQIGNAREWKAQTVISLMLRLVERGFLRTEKRGKERTYFPTAKREDYLKFETDVFFERFHNNSFLNLVNTLYGDKALDDGDIAELLQWLRERRA